MIQASAFLLIGLVLLILGGELLVRGASQTALSFGIKPIIIGLTIVAFGTSMPEAFVSVVAGLERKPDIALGNVVGSNIFNIAFILGVAALIRPLKVELGSIRREIPFLLASSAMLYLFTLDRTISRIEGLALLAVFMVFLWVCFRSANRTSNSAETVNVRLSAHMRPFILILSSLVLLVLGSKGLVHGAVQLARGLGISELVIGLTIVAAGTSLPELATSVMASIRKKDDIAVGNVTGSNIFNILFILGIAAMIHPLHVNEALFCRDLLVLMLMTLILLPILKTGFVVSRWEGAVLLIGYGLYVGWLISVA